MERFSKHTSDSEVNDLIPLLPELQVLVVATKARQKRPSEKAQLLTRYLQHKILSFKTAAISALRARIKYVCVHGRKFCLQSCYWYFEGVSPLRSSDLFVQAA